MARNDDTLWYTLGRAARAIGAFLPLADAGPASAAAEDDEGFPRPVRRRRPPPDLEDDALPRLLTGALAAAVAAGVVKWARAHRPSPKRLARGAVAGAAAAGIVLAGRAFLESRRNSRADDEGFEPGPEEPAVDLPEVLAELLSGAGRGLLYTALLDPLLPGPPILKGALVGTAEHFTAPLGGLYATLEPVSPLRKVPLVSALLRAGSDDDRDFVIHLANGILLGLLSGSGDEVTHEGEEES